MHTEIVCRVCLSECQQLTPLRETLPGENRTLFDTINFVVNDNIKLEDGLPDKICHNCESLLNVADTFKRRCLESEEILSQQTKEKSDESRRDNNEENNEVSSETSSISCILLSDSSSDDEESIYHFQHDIKIEIEEEFVDNDKIFQNKDKIQDPEAAPAKEINNVDSNVSEKYSVDLETNNSQLTSKNYSNRQNISHFSDELRRNEDVTGCRTPAAQEMEKFECFDCKKTFTSMDNIKLHIRTHSKQAVKKTKLFTCKICKRNFPSKDSLEAHILNHRKGPPRLTRSLKYIRPITADIAPITARIAPITEEIAPSATEDQQANNSTAPETVVNDIEKDENTYITRKKVIKKKLKLKKNKTTNKKKLKLNKNKITKSVDKIKKKHSHRISHENRKIVQNVRSTESNISAIREIFTCDICEYSTIKLKSLNSHLKAHAATKRYSCDDCPYLTTSSRSYQAHAWTHTGERPYSCKICAKMFRDKNTLHYHVKTHTGIKPYSCNTCAKKFTFKCALVRHVKIHTGNPKPYCCNICERKFNQKPNLERHLKTHTGDYKPYVCSVCEKKFSQKPNLERHLKIHTDDKPYSCTVCDKKFRQKPHLITHVRTHTGDKPFGCHICEKKFCRKDALNVHIRGHYRVKLLRHRGRK